MKRKRKLFATFNDLNQVSRFGSFKWDDRRQLWLLTILIVLATQLDTSTFFRCQSSKICVKTIFFLYRIIPTPSSLSLLHGSNSAAAHLHFCTYHVKWLFIFYTVYYKYLIASIRPVLMMFTTRWSNLSLKKSDYKNIYKKYLRVVVTQIGSPIPTISRF